jgi:hypothetical protein
MWSYLIKSMSITEYERETIKETFASILQRLNVIFDTDKQQKRLLNWNGEPEFRATFLSGDNTHLSMKIIN